MMKTAEVGGMSIPELQKKEAGLAEELFRLRFRKSTGQLERVSELGRIRRDIARIKTILRQKEVAQ